MHDTLLFQHLLHGDFNISQFSQKNAAINKKARHITQ